MLSSESGGAEARLYPDATWISVTDRQHDDADLVLWCLEGSGVAVTDGLTTQLRPQRAVIVPAGTRHSVHMTGGSLVYPIFLPARLDHGEPLSIDVPDALADALLFLAVATTTGLTPSADRLKQLTAAITQIGESADGPSPHSLPTLPTTFIPWVVSDDETVVVWCAAGRATIVIGDRHIDVVTDQALVIPPRVEHRIVGSTGNVLVPVFLPGACADQARLVRVDHELSRALHAQNLFDTTLLGPRGWDVATLVDALATSFGSPIDTAGPPALERIVQVQRRLLKSPSDTASVEQLASGVGVSARSLERDFAAAVGEPLRSWRSRLRMSVARDALLRGERPSSVAHRLGFAHQSALTRAYRREYGIAPSGTSRIPSRADAASS